MDWIMDLMQEQKKTQFKIKIRPFSSLRHDVRYYHSQYLFLHFFNAPKFFVDKYGSNRTVWVDFFVIYSDFGLKNTA